MCEESKEILVPEIDDFDIFLAEQHAKLAHKDAELAHKNAELAHMNVEMVHKDVEIKKLKRMLAKAGIQA